jgi:uncharacterized membrane protein YdjX (TVP38/TMEM64 family)
VKRFVKTIVDFDFWLEVFAYLRELGPVAPIFLAFMESVLPFLPLIGIVTVNVGAYGVVWGLSFSWIGASFGALAMFSFYRRFVRSWFNLFCDRHPRFRFARTRRVVENMSGWTLFILAVLPFTPIALLNFAFAVSNYSAKKYLGILCSAKLVMISIMVMISESMFIGLKYPVFLVISAVLLITSIVLSRLAVKYRLNRSKA